MYIPKEIKAYIKGDKYKLDNIGMSESNILIFDNYVLKINKNLRDANNEYKINKWLDGKINVAKIYVYTIKYNKAYTLMEKVNGVMLCDAQMMNSPSLVTKILADTFKKFWSLNISDCPCLNDNKRKLEIALENIKNNLPDFNVDEIKKYTDIIFDSPMDLWNYLNEHKIKEELVFSHGDMCLPNIIYDNGKVTIIDLGLAGICDKYADIAIAYRSLMSNANGKYSNKRYDGYYNSILFDELGIKVDKEKLLYFLLLDELF